MNTYISYIYNAYTHTLIGSLRQYNSAAIRGAIEWLSDEGHIYSTIDDDHFKALDDD